MFCLGSLGNIAFLNKTALGVKRPFSEQLSEFWGTLRATSRNCAHDLIYVKTLFSEQLSERLSGLVGRQDFSPNS